MVLDCTPCVRQKNQGQVAAIGGMAGFRLRADRLQVHDLIDIAPGEDVIVSSNSLVEPQGTQQERVAETDGGGADQPAERLDHAGGEGAGPRAVSGGSGACR